MEKKLLAIYINDHLAGHVAGIELAKRTAANNEGNEIGAFLHTFIPHLEQERAVMEQALEEIDSDPSRLKTMAAWVAEKAGRFKLNGQVTGYSPLSRVLELEALSHGLNAKIDLWKTLQRLGVATNAGPDGLIEQAEQDRAALVAQHEKASSLAFSGERA